MKKAVKKAVKKIDHFKFSKKITKKIAKSTEMQSVACKKMQKTLESYKNAKHKF